MRASVDLDYFQPGERLYRAKETTEALATHRLSCGCDLVVWVCVKRQVVIIHAQVLKPVLPRSDTGLHCGCERMAKVKEMKDNQMDCRVRALWDAG